MRFILPFEPGLGNLLRALVSALWDWAPSGSPGHRRAHLGPGVASAGTLGAWMLACGVSAKCLDPFSGLFDVCYEQQALMAAVPNVGSTPFRDPYC